MSVATQNPAVQDLSDYASLLRQGMLQLQALAGPDWTDFNAQDPGITILEQCCYALTELAYRCDFPLPDLLSSGGKNPADQLYGAASILGSRPVTLTDLRKLAVDVRGVRNAWIESAAVPDPPVYLAADGIPASGDPHKGMVLLRADPAFSVLPMKGLFRVWIEASNELGVTAGELARNVGARLHAARPLGMDFASVDVLKPRSIQVNATIEIGAEATPDDVYAAIVLAIAAQTSPRVRFRSLAQCVAAGWQIDEIFAGPPLQQGFVDTAELAALERRRALRVSDFVQAVMRVEGVALVKQLALSAGGAVWQDWWLDIDDGEVPQFDWNTSNIVLQRQQLTLSVDRAAAGERVTQVLAAGAYRQAQPEELDILPAPGRDRQVGNYYSIQHHFPENYGLGERGLPPEANDLRRAQLRQLQAYLLLFDQLLANQHAQLAHLGDLLGFAGNAPQTYFAGDMDDASLGLDPVWRRADRGERAARLARIVEAPAAGDMELGAAPDWARKNRLLDHLLARFAEQFVNPDGVLPLSANSDQQARLRDLALAKQAWLRNYPALGSARGSGRDLTRAPAPAEDAGLEQRLRIKLGLAPENPEQRFFLVEHLLLRPVAADSAQGALPLLAEVRGADPYSLQISLVMPAWAGRCAVPAFKQFVEQTLREEIPAHLFAYVVWLNQADMALFADAHQTWLDSQRQVRLAQGGAAEWLRQRDARDRLIDLLKLGHSYPLADLPVEYTKVVAWGQSGRVTLMVAQTGVAYQLLAKNGSPLTPPVNGVGQGSDLLLTTPRITGDVDFVVRATRPSSGYSRNLYTKIQIRVGLDTSLIHFISGADLLVADDTAPDAARIIDFAAQAEVSVEASQAGVDYRLLTPDSQAAGGYRTISVADVRGNAATIELQTQQVQEDCMLRVRATKTFDAGDNQPTMIDALIPDLPLKVRANPGLAVSLPKSVVDYKAAATLVVKSSQASASYQVWARDIGDSEFLRSTNATAIPIAGFNSLWVSAPPLPAPDVQAAGAAAAGTGNNLSLPITALKEDSLLVVHASKSHANPRGGAPVGSTIQLASAAVILVRPGTAADFPLRLSRRDDTGVGPGLAKNTAYLVANGQPGVYYHFRLAGSDQDLGLPVYFHKPEKGIGGLAVEIDFALAGQMPSPPPEWDCPVDLAATDKLSIRAVKAQTGLETVFELAVSALVGAV
ncbi:MAG: hypothetical protein JNM98_16000 [Rhodocyclaceae bacterium]|nr:hypothetical protein [Rhodocyclaceae bacterium]